MELSPPAAVDPPRRGARRRARPRRICSGPSTSSRGRCCARCEHPGPRPAVLLIDEIDRADDDFEAFLLELLAEAAVTIPELGHDRRHATRRSIVLTSNRTRDLHDAVKRRCLYQWIDYPEPGARGRDRPPPRPGRLADARGAGGRRGRADARLRRAEAARDRRGDRLAGGAERCWGSSELDEPRDDADARLGAQVPRGPGGRPRRGIGQARRRMPDDGVRDGRARPAATGRRLRRGACATPGCRSAPERAARFADALALVTRPMSRRRLYWTARAVFVSDRDQVRLFDAVFAEVFGRWGLEPATRPIARRPSPGPTRRRAPTPAAGARATSGADVGASAARRRRPRRRASDGTSPTRELPVPTLATDEEVLRAKHFDALEPDELAPAAPADVQLVARDAAATHPAHRAPPPRRTASTCGARLRGSLRTGGDPLRLARRDAGGSCAGGSCCCATSRARWSPMPAPTCSSWSVRRGRAARRGVRVRHPADAADAGPALPQPRPGDRAAAAATAPDWSSGTRIGDALKDVQRSPRPPRDGPRRGRRDPVRRLGAR